MEASERGESGISGRKGSGQAGGLNLELTKTRELSECRSQSQSIEESSIREAKFSHISVIIALKNTIGGSDSSDVVASAEVGEEMPGTSRVGRQLRPGNSKVCHSRDLRRIHRNSVSDAERSDHEGNHKKGRDRLKRLHHVQVSNSRGVEDLKERPKEEERSFGGC